MPSTSSIKAGEAFVAIVTDQTGLERGLNSAKEQVRRFAESISDVGKQMMGIGATLATPLLASAKIFGSIGAELYQMSLKTGVSAERLSTFTQVLNMVGIDGEQANLMFRRMMQSIGN